MKFTICKKYLTYRDAQSIMYEIFYIGTSIMPFHEKSAWIMTTALLGTSGMYFAVIVSLSNKLGQLAPPLLPLIVIYTVALIVIAVVGHLLIALFSPKDANAPLDERERLIHQRAGHWSGLVIGAGVIFSLALYLFTYNGHLLFYAVFASLIVSTIVEYACQIVLYRTR